MNPHGEVRAHGAEGADVLGIERSFDPLLTRPAIWLPVSMKAALGRSLQPCGMRRRSRIAGAKLIEKLLHADQRGKAHLGQASSASPGLRRGDCCLHQSSQTREVTWHPGTYVRRHTERSKTAHKNRHCRWRTEGLEKGSVANRCALLRIDQAEHLAQRFG